MQTNKNKHYFLYAGSFLCVCIALILGVALQKYDHVQSVLGKTIDQSTLAPYITAVSNSKVLPDSFYFAKDLEVGSQGPDVLELQKILNADSLTQVASEGHGSSGHETTFFGLKTLDAVKRFQSKYKNEILLPLGLEKPTGKVRAQTRIVLNATLLAQKDVDTNTVSLNNSAAVSGIGFPQTGGALPSVSLSLNPPLPLQRVRPSTEDIKVAYYTIKVPTTSDALEILSIPVLYIHNGKPDDVSGCQFFSGVEPLTSETRIVNPSRAHESGTVISFYLDHPLVIPAGSERELMLQCDVTEFAQPGTIYSFGVGQNLLIRGVLSQTVSTVTLPSQSGSSIVIVNK